MDPFQSEFEHQFILQAIGDAIIITVDLDRRILWAISSFPLLFCYSSGEKNYRNLFSLEILRFFGSGLILEDAL